MNLIVAQNLARYYGSYKLLGEVNFTIYSGDRIGLIGQNGTGKSTLLEILSRQLDYDGDDETRLVFASGLRIGYLRQQDELGGDLTLWQSMQGVFDSLLNLERQMREHEELMSNPEVYNNPEKLEQVNDKYGRMSIEFERQGGYVINSRIRAVLFGLGFQENQFNQDLQSLSGGERMRGALARQLLQLPDILLLDEPTNHLDIEAVEWLEDYLNSYGGAVLLVSHDRYFLDRIATRIFEIEYNTLTEYTGNYTAFLAQKEANLKREAEVFKQIEAERRHLQSFIDRFRYGTKASLAKSRAKMLERLGHYQAPKTAAARMNFALHATFRSANRVLMIKGLKKSFTKALFGPLDIEVTRGERIALVGPNGAGKSTLLSILTGEIEADEGESQWGVAVDWGFYKQGLDDLEESNTVLDEILEAAPGLTVGEGRDVLGRFLFRGEDVYKKVSVLSGGERSRVMLSKLLLLGANCLLLDEPTNHLDIAAREVLEEALRDFEGTLIVVSHDRYFVDRVATKIWELKDGELRVFKEGWTGYHEFQIREANEVLATKQREQVRVKKVEDTSREYQKLLRALKNDLTDLEQQIKQWEQEKLDLEIMMSEMDFSKREDQLLRIQRYRELPGLLTDAYRQWDEIAEELHEMESNGENDA